MPYGLSIKGADRALGRTCSDVVDDIAQEAGGRQPGRTVTARDQALLDPLQSIKDDLRAARGFKRRKKSGKRVRTKRPLRRT